MGIGKWIIKTAWNKLSSSDQAGIAEAVAKGRGQICPNCKGAEMEESIKYVEYRGKNYWKNNSTGKWAYCPRRRNCLWLWLANPSERARVHFARASLQGYLSYSHTQFSFH